MFGLLKVLRKMFEYVDRRPLIVPCRIVFAMPEDFEMWPYHLSLRFFIVVRRSSCTSTAFCCEPLRSSHGLCKSPIACQGLGSFSRFLDLKLRKHIADLDLIDKDRIYK